MSLSSLLVYDSDDDDDQREQQQQQQQQQSPSSRDGTPSSPPAVPASVAVHPANRSTRVTAPVAVLEQKPSTAERKRKRKREQQQQEEAVDGGRQRQLGTESSSFSSSSSAASTLAFLSSPPSRSTILSFPPSASDSAAATADLASLLPPPVHAAASSSTRLISPSATPADAGSASALPVAPAVSSTPSLPPTSAHFAPSVSTPAPSASAAMPVAPSPAVLPPPGMRHRPVAATVGSQSGAAPQSKTMLNGPQQATEPPIPISVSSSASFSPASDAVIPPAWDEPRMQRQFASAMGSVIDISADDLTSPLSLSSSSSAQPSHAAPKLRTVYWDARAGREVLVEGTEGKQRRVHQINSLALQAQKLEGDILRARDNGSNIRRMARQKYGW